MTRMAAAVPPALALPQIPQARAGLPPPNSRSQSARRSANNSRKPATTLSHDRQSQMPPATNSTAKKAQRKSIMNQPPSECGSTPSKSDGWLGALLDWLSLLAA